MENIVKMFYWMVRAIVVYSVLSFMAIVFSLVILKIFGRYSFGDQFYLNRIVYLSVVSGLVITVSSVVIIIINYLSGSRMDR